MRSRSRCDCTRCGRDGHDEKWCGAELDIEGRRIDGGTHQPVKRVKRSVPARTQTNTLADILQSKEITNEEEEGDEGVYILKLDDGCRYVGKSNNVSKRIEEHRNGAGAEWCKLHGIKQLQVMPVISRRVGDDLNLWEQNETIHQMMQHGTSMVRGWAFTNPVLHQGELNMIKTLVFESADVCRKCGYRGHFANSCNNVHVAQWLRDIDRSLSIPPPRTTTKRYRPTSSSVPSPARQFSQSSRQLPPFCVELAKSGRSGCRACNTKIAKGERRRGTLVVPHYPKTPFYEWRHMHCGN